MQPELGQWKIRVVCPNGHRWEVPVECQDCERRAEAPLTTPRPPGRLRLWWLTRKARRDAGRLRPEDF